MPTDIFSLDNAIIGRQPTPEALAARRAHVASIFTATFKVSPVGREVLEMIVAAVPPYKSGFSITSDPIQAARYEGIREVVSFLCRASAHGAAVHNLE